MKPVEPSCEQRAAIFAPRSVAVRAGAGSGKTEVLARRFVAMLAGDIPGIEPLSPERIAAITFTEKATYDMKRRIAAVLERELAAAEGERATLLGRARRLLPLARISTIHAFCARILRENPLEAGLDPDFSVLDEDQSRTFLEKNIEELLITALRRQDPGARHLAGARGLRGGVYREGAVEVLLRLVTEVQRLGKDAAWLRETTAIGCARLREEAAGLGESAKRLVTLIEELRRAEFKPASQAAEAMRQLEPKWPQFRLALESFGAERARGDLNALRELCETLPHAKGPSKEQVGHIRTFLQKDGSRVGLGGELIERYGAQRAIQPTLDTCALAAHVVEEIERRKRRDGVVTFDDLLRHTYRLLSDDAAIAHRYRRNLGAILIDEYQDTDAVQDAIVQLLTENREDTSGLNYFIVGDEKQSIYRFRGADVSVFKRAREAAPSGLALSENRRAVPSLLNFVNLLSAHVMRSTNNPAAEFWVEWSDNHRLRAVRSEVANDEVSVEIMLCPDAGRNRERNITLRRRDEARAIADRCREIFDSGMKITGIDGTLRAASPRDIALLLRSFEDVEIYERALVESAIPCYTVKGRGFYGCREILDIAELLTAVNDPSDSLAVASALRSPFFSLSDQCLMEIAFEAHRGGLSLAQQFERDGFDWLASGRDDAIRAASILRELRAMLEIAPLTTLIERALELTDFETVLIAQTQGEQRVANIRKLVDMARDFESRSFFTLADFISHLRRSTTDQPKEAQAQLAGEDEDVMRLMTIHQAKGLEFPIVVLADLGRQMPHAKSNYLLSPDHGLLLCDTVGSGHDELRHPLIGDCQQTVADQETAESARLLYVAITRARDRLILSEGPGAREWAKLLRNFLGARANAFLGSGKSHQAIEIEDARITLRRVQPPDREPLQSDRAPDADRRDLELMASSARARLEFAAAHSEELVVSPTALADFARCPRQYHFRHAAHLPEHDGFSSGEGGAAERGNIAHAILESIDFDLRGSKLEQAIASAMAGCAGNLLAPADEAVIARDLRRYVQSRPSHERVLAREVPFFMNIAEPGMSLFVRGQIDLIADDGETIIVRDYKYARRREEDPPHYQIPMECYRIAVAEAHPGRDVRAELIFLRDGPQAYEIQLPEVEASRAGLLRIARAMLAAQAGADYPRNPAHPDECYRLRCGYVRRCWRSQDH